MTSLRAAIYARFSSDLQRDRSIEDQVALCRQYADRNGYEIVALFEDRGISGATIQHRPGIQALQQAARAGAFEFIIAESLSRLSRDQEDSAAIRKRLEFAGVAIVTTADGIVSPLLHGLRSIIDSQFLIDLKGSIRRGMKGVIRDGRHAGGQAYGYRSIAGKPGELEVLPEQAEVIRRIFSEYLDGSAPRAIATRLNAEAVPAPRGRYWRASTINGHAQRKTGILQNELLCGRLIWNRAYRVRDPDTGRRIWRYKPESEWQRADAPHLRIIADDVFDQAQAIRARRAMTRPHASAAPKRILSGLLRCGACGAGMSKKDTDHGRPRCVCTRMKESRTCDHRRVYYLDEIEHMVVDGLRDQLGTREAIDYFVQRYNERRQQAVAGALNGRAAIEHRLVLLERKIARAVAAVVEESITREEAEVLLPGLRLERDAAAAELAATAKPVPIIRVRAGALEKYLDAIERLPDVLNDGLADGHFRAAVTIRSYVDTVTVMPTPAGGPPSLVLRGQLQSLIGLDPFPDGSHFGGEGGAG